MLGAQLNDAEHDQQRGTSDQRRDDPRIRPSPGSCLLEAEDGHAEGSGDDHGPRQVDGLTARLWPWCSQPHQDETDDGQGHVHPEHGTPGPRTEVTAGNGSQSRHGAGDRKEARHRTCSSCPGEGLDDQTDRGRVHQCAGHALQSSRGDQPRPGVVTVRCETTQQRGAPEGRDPDQRHPAMSQDVGQPPAEQEERGGGDQVDVDGPLHRAVGDSEIPLDRRPGQRHDGLIYRRHRHSDDQSHHHGGSVGDVLFRHDRSLSHNSVVSSLRDLE